MSTPATPSLAATPPATSPPAAGDGAISIVVAGGKVLTKDKTVNVKLGDQVTLIVTSDVADEVHVHGYDIKKDVAAGAPVMLTFKADQPGRFTVELEVAKLDLIDLRVR